MHRLITSIRVNAAFSTRDVRVLSFIQLSLAISIARLFPFLKHDIIAVVSSSRASHHCVGETSFCVLYFFFWRKNERAVPSCRQLRRRTFIVQFSPPTTIAKTKAVPEARVPNQRGRVRGANGRRKQRAGESTKAEKSERCSQRRFEAVRGTDEECINHHHERQVFLVLGGRRGRRREERQQQESSKSERSAAEMAERAEEVRVKPVRSVRSRRFAFSFESSIHR